MNKSIVAMLKTLEETEKKSWKNHVQKLVYGYNYTKHSPQPMNHIFFCLGGSSDPQLTLYLNLLTRQPNKHTLILNTNG